MTYSDAFFEISAQLIPVLFLAMVVEEKLQPEAEESASDRVTRSWLLASLFIGELMALTVVAGALPPSSGIGSLIALSMLFAGFLITLPVIAREVQAGRSRREKAGHATAGVAVIAILLLAIADVGIF